jgi:mannose-6-phosphate isomerase-like protein (cupin superfamily)
MEIKRVGSQASGKGPADWFTGTVRIDPLFQPSDPVEEIRPGDVVWFPPGEKHWHGASPTTAMTHIAIQESLDGKAVDWMEHVTDEQYGG